MAQDYDNHDDHKEQKEHVDHVKQADRSLQGKKEHVNNVNVMAFIGNFAFICGDYWGWRRLIG